jgi:predicted nucleotidyltransferase component of viral defense system
MPNGDYIMTMELLTKAQFQIINRSNKLGYPLDTAEKDYFLALVSEIIHESPLNEKLVFKGGTALHHTYFPQLRFSEDLDFTAVSAITIEEIGRHFLLMP